MSASWPHGRGKGPMTRGMRPDGFAGIEEPVNDTTAQREGRTYKRKVTGSTRRGDRNLRPREPEAQTDEDDDDSHVGFEGQYVYHVPDFGLDEDDDVGNTDSASMTNCVAATSSGGATHRRGSTSSDTATRPWKLAGPAPGGPTDYKLIPSFGAHVAYDIWEGKARSMVKLQSRTKAVTGWRGPTDARSVALLEGTGLYQLQHCVLPQHNNPLIEAFIERWQPDTNTFHMPFGEMTITLHDVHYIMGLRVSGHRPYTDMQKSLVIEFGSRIFDLDILKIESWWHNGGPRLEDLQELYGDHSSASSECKVRAYIIYLLGSTLFVNKSGARVKPDFCPLIEDIEQIREYSWGSGTLANLYRQLGMASRVEAKQISGCLTQLECWIYEYFPSFRPPTVKAHVIGEPWCMRWHISDVVRKDSSRLLEYRRMLDHLRATDVYWTPFGPNVARDVEKTLHHGTIRFMDTIEPYMCDRVLRQFGFRQIIPASPIQPMRGSKRERKIVSYKVRYESNDYAWSIPNVHRLEQTYYGHRADPAWEVATDYMDWYIPRTHLRVDPSTGLLERAEPSLVPFVYDITRLLHPYYYDHLPPSRIPGYHMVPDDVFRQVQDLCTPFSDYLQLQPPDIPDDDMDAEHDTGPSRMPYSQSRRQRRD
ncbi:PREDICTED: serine/threonine-protein phosphatase 7 long form homolog, partial [Erythranthe guttata]|uniref:serine/threonine-protein phosphatase 7 long form homolog n=1 Tax=Erythranthe guttata TaxID=4155 RepID=UPI00064DC9DA